MKRYLSLVKYLTPNTFLKRARLSRKLYYYTILCVMALTGISVFLYQTYFVEKVSAAWFNEDWIYRIKVPITVHNTEEKNVYISVTISTADTTTRHQTDCGDLRFTDANGNLLPFYIVSGCGTSTTLIHVFFDTFPAGPQDIYYYYGNFTSLNGFSASDFATEATNYTVDTLGTEEKGVGPDHYWKLDDITTNVPTSSGAMKREMGLYNGPTFKTEDLCFVGCVISCFCCKI